METVNIVKIGSDSVCLENIEKLVKDIKIYEEGTGEKFIIISSGAVKLGKEIVSMRGGKTSDLTTASFASIGQQFLMQMYDKVSGDKIVGEVLLDDYVNSEYIDKFARKFKLAFLLKGYVSKILKLVNYEKDKHLAATVANLVRNYVLVIINHSDATSEQELKTISDKTDNDKNTVHIAEVLCRFQNETKLKVGKVIYLTNTDGVLDENGETVLGGSIDKSNVDTERNYYLSHVTDNQSNGGTGGMASKINCAFDVLLLCAKQAIISNARNGLDCLMNNYIKATKFE